MALGPLSDAELQAYLDGEPAADRAAVERRLAADPEARAALAAYRRVWAGLGPAATPFAAGFADRVADRVRAEAAPARDVPWAEYALLALVVAAGLAAAVAFRDVVAASWLGAVAPAAALGAAVLLVAEAADRVLVRRPGLAG